MMNQQVADRVLPIAAAVSIPVIIVGSRLILGDGIPPQALAVMAAAWAMALVWSAMHMAGRPRAAQPEVEAARVDVVAQAMALLESLQAPQRPCQIEVMSEVGVCPRGLKAGASLSVDSEGRLSAPICRAAAEALQPLVTMPPLTEGPWPQVSCMCPKKGVHLTFAVGPTGTSTAI